MSWPTFLAPVWALMGLLGVPLILLYVLRQRRPDMAISSTLLWSKALADMRASTPFQKLRRNLLLLLQLLILAALVFTLMRPVIQTHVDKARAGIIVIDATASMQARDGDENGSTRLERAKREAKTLVEGMRPGDRFKIIADGGGLNRIGNDFMSSKSELLRIIDSIKPSDTPSDLSESLLLAAESLRAVNAGKAEGASTADAVDAGKIFLFSDGGVRLPDAFGESASALQFIKIGSSDHSVGITRLSVQPVPGEPRTYEIFVGLKNAWSEQKRVGVLLAYGAPDKFMTDQAKFVTLPPSDVNGGQASVTFERVMADPGKLYVRLDDKDDIFPLDNTAYAMITPPRKPKVVLVAKNSPLMEHFLQAATNIGILEAQVIDPDKYAANIPGDLFIFDEFLPAEEKMPKADALIINPPVTQAGMVGGFKIGNEITQPQILQWRREDPLMQVVELTEVQIGRSLLIDSGQGTVDLVTTSAGPIIAYKDFGAARRYLIGFSPISDSNWWRLPSLLVFLKNLITQTAERHYIGMPELFASGSPAKLWEVGDENGNGDVRITLPDGTQGMVQAHDGAAEFAQTDQVGFYEVDSGGRHSTFAVNLLSPSESDIRPRSINTTPGSHVEEAVSVAAVNKEIWRWLAAAALVVLLIEWWVYHRRIV